MIESERRQGSRTSRYLTDETGGLGLQDCIDMAITGHRGLCFACRSFKGFRGPVLSQPTALPHERSKLEFWWSVAHSLNELSRSQGRGVSATALALKFRLCLRT